MDNTVRQTSWAVGLPDRQLELFCNDVRRALNQVYWETFTTTTALTAAATDIWSATLPSNSAWSIAFDVVGIATDGSAAGYQRLSRFRRAGAGATLMGTDTIGTDREDVAGWDVTVSASGTDAVLQVTGDATRTVSWKAMIRILEVR